MVPKGGTYADIAASRFYDCARSKGYRDGSSDRLRRSRPFSGDVMSSSLAPEQQLLR